MTLLRIQRGRAVNRYTNARKLGAAYRSDIIVSRQSLIHKKVKKRKKSRGGRGGFRTRSIIRIFSYLYKGPPLVKIGFFGQKWQNCPPSFFFHFCPIFVSEAI